MNPQDVRDDRDDADDAPPADPTGPVLRTAELFGDRREVWIEHNGERYRLRITRRGRLILQK
ncbi:MAG: hemin uptake protein HemP [Fimbriiglobus sp.]